MCEGNARGSPFSGLYSCRNWRHILGDRAAFAGSVYRISYRTAIKHPNSTTRQKALQENEIRIAPTCSRAHAGKYKKYPTYSAEYTLTPGAGVNGTDPRVFTLL